MGETITVENGCKVKIKYTLTEHGKTEVIDATEKHGGEPLEYTQGAGQIIKGLEQALQGKTVGKIEEPVVISPELAYGEKRDDLYRHVPKTAVNGAEHLKEGDMVGATNGGHTFRALVDKITDTEVVLNFNHPLAGKTLQFVVEIVDIQKPQA